MLESLERRQLLADISLVNGTLRIVGTAGNDQIDFALFSKTQFQVLDGGSVAQTFERDVVKAISFAGLAGDDVLIVGRVPLRLFANGGDGNDAFSAAQGSFRDTLVGGAGDDYLFGGDGADTLDGGLGEDGLFGDGGNDTIRFVSDDLGDDTVTGGGGSDTADASQYTEGVVLRVGDRTPAVLTISDFIFEDVETIIGSGFDDNINTVAGRPLKVFLGPGDDIFTGGRGNDTIFGTRGTDEIFTAGGDDLIFDLDEDTSVDVVIGGSGNDIAYVDATDDVRTSVETRRTSIADVTFNDDGTITFPAAA